MTKNKEQNKKETIIVEGVEENLLDQSTKKILKYIIIFISILIIFIICIQYTFINIQNNNVGVIESFFSKNISVYTKSGIKIINPFSFNKKTTYPLSVQTIKFIDNPIIKKDSDGQINTIEPNISIYDDIYNAGKLQINTKDEISVNVKLSISYKIKEDSTGIKTIYNNTGNGNFVEKIVVPTITSSVSKTYSKYTLIDIVSKNTKENKTTVSIGTILKENIKKDLENKGFELINFTFGGIGASEGVTKTIEELFNTQNQLELEKTKLKILELQNTNSLKQLELTNSIYKTLEKNNISITDYQKVKLIQIFEDKWNGNTIPQGLNSLIQN